MGSVASPQNGHEYVTILGPGPSTRHRGWNVIANASFGFQVSESGSGYTWSGNSPREPAHAVVQRPVSDPAGEASTSGDDDSGELLGPYGTADPPRGIDVYRASRRRLQPVRAYPRRHRTEPRPVRPARTTP